jgi:pimeloyl-ACP methyl ester carboxylesterase
MSQVDVAGVGIDYQVTGQGRPVVLLHGFPDSGRLWRHQVPALAAAGFRVIVPDLRGCGRSGNRHPDTDRVIADLQAGGSLTPGLNWYRANMPPAAWVRRPPALGPVRAPAMGIWSSGDFALTEDQMTASAAHVAGPWRYERIDGPGHWMQLDAPAAVNGLLLDFLPR